MDKVIKVLLVEDDPLDQIQVQRALDKKGILYKLQITGNGEEALHFLNGTLPGEFNGIPDFILLDLSMPKMNGFEFYRELRRHPEWADVKVFLLTNSDQEREVANDMGISGYIVKPLTFNSPSLDTITLMIDIMNVQA